MQTKPHPMKALSIRQPWAWAVIHGGKNVENRSEAAVRQIAPRALGQRILIHAAKTMRLQDYEYARALMAKIGIVCPPREDLPLGGVVGSVRVVAVVRKSHSPWFSGPCGLTLAEPKPLAFFPVRGRLGLFNVEIGGKTHRWSAQL